MSQLAYYMTGADNSTWVLQGSQWIQVWGAASLPGDLHSGLLVYDSDRKRDVFILTVGMINRVATWEWDGTAWQENTAANTPRALGQWSYAAFSPDLHSIVMLNLAVTGPQPTYLYNGTSWRAVTTAHQPPTGAAARLAYDPVRKAIIALGLNDFRTWVFSGTDWTPLGLTGPTPGPRQNAAIGFDPNHERWVVFGGVVNSSGSPVGDTWTGDGNTWTQLKPSQSPTARAAGDQETLVLDPVHQRLVMFGGMVNNFQTQLQDTWAWDGANWTRVAGPAY